MKVLQLNDNAKTAALTGTEKIHFLPSNTWPNNRSKAVTVTYPNREQHVGRAVTKEPRVRKYLSKYFTLLGIHAEKLM